MSTSSRLFAPLLITLAAALALGGLVARPAEAANAGSISGKVTTTSSSTGIAADVVLYRRDSGGAWNQWRFRQTTSGSYSFTGLPFGTFRVEVRPADSTLQTPTFVGSGAPYAIGAGRDVVLPTASSTSSGNDVAVPKGGSIAGKVLSNGKPVTEDDGSQGVPVRASVVQGWDVVDVGTVPRSSASTGAYTITGLPVAAIRVCADGAEGGADTCWQNARDVYAATDIAMAAQQVRTGYDLTYVTPGTVTGTVTGEGGVPLEGAAVDVYVREGSEWVSNRDEVETDATGVYTARLRPGTYRFCYVYEGLADQCFDDAGTVETATDVTVAASSTRTINAELAEGKTVTGTVSLASTGATGNGYEVTALRKVGDEFRVQATTDVTPNQEYTITGLPRGDYTFVFSDDQRQFATQYWKNKPSLEAATIEEIGARGLTGVDARLQLAGSISGTVTGPSGGLADVDVSVHAADSSGGWVELDDWSATTSASGAYSIAGLPAGSYRVGFAPAGDTLRGEFWNDAPTIRTAADVTVTSGKATPLGATALTATGPQVVAPARPTISSTAPKVGTTISASTGTWSPSGTALSYQWFADGQAIDDARARQKDFTPTVDEVGKALTVVVTGTHPDLAGSTSTAPSAATAKVATATLTTATPKLSTTKPVVGTRLTVSTTGWTSGTELLVEWYADGKKVGTGDTFTVTSAQRGDAMKAKVTGSKPGYTSTYRVSSSSSSVGYGTLSATTPKITGAAKVGETLTAVPGAWGLEGVALTYRWYVDGKAISVYTPTYVVHSSRAGKTIKVKVTGRLSGYTTRSVYSASTAKIAKGTLAAGEPAISGTPTVGSTLRAAAGTWGPTSSSLSYQWLRDGKAISRATKSTYKLSSYDRGRAVSVRVTGKASGFTPSSIARTAPSLAVS